MRAIGLPLAAALALAAPTAPLGAVGLGPLNETGVIDGNARGFSLTLINPYGEAVAYRAYAVGETDEMPQSRVTIYPEQVVLGANASRRLLVIASDLVAGEFYHFRVCAERLKPPPGAEINARVCSNLSVRRLG